MTAISWKTGVNGDWESPLNWSPSFVPGAVDAVTIGVAGNYTITVRFIETAGSLALTASGAVLLLDAGLRVTSLFSETSGAIAVASGQTLSVTGTASFGLDDSNRGGTVRGPGTLATSGATTLVAQTKSDFVDLYLGGGATWSNTGTVTDAGAVLYGLASGDTATIANQAGAVFDLTTDNAEIAGFVSSSTATFSNAGTLEKTGGPGASVISAAVANAATGVIDVTSGTLSLTGGGTLGGTIETSGGDLVAFAAGSFTLADAKVPAALLVDGGTVNVTTPITFSGPFSETSGAIAVASGQTLSVTGTASFGLDDSNRGGTVRGPGTLATSGATTLVAQTKSDFVDLYLGGGATWSNTGTVTDAGAVLYGLASGDTATIANQAGAVFDLTTDNAEIAGFVSSSTATFSNAGTLEKTGGPGASVISAAVANAATGVIDVTSGTLSLEGRLTNAGRIVADKGGEAVLGAIGADTGTIIIGSTGTVDFTAATTAGVTFGSPGGRLILSTPSSYAGTIFNFAVDDTIDLATIPYSSAGTVQIEPGNILHVVEGTTKLNLQLDPAETFSAAVPHLSMDGAGSDVTLTGVVCFAAGTHLLSERGDIAVETVREGDWLVSLRDGERRLRQVRWIGHRRMDLRRHPDPAQVCPVIIAAGAIGDNLPRRDLVVSPDHAVLAHGMLVPARLLLNGATVRQDAHARSVTYFHVELAEHALLMAEGMAAESYLDTGNRAFFAGPVTDLRPTLAHDPARRSLPLDVAPDRARVAWEHVAGRARARGHAVALPEVAEDPELRLLVGPRVLRPAFVSGLRYVFAVPPGAGSVRLASRVGRPSDAEPWHDDRRPLGVNVARMTLRGPTTDLAIALDGPEIGTGWWPCERAAGVPRWTAGDAAFAMPADGGVLEVTLAGTARYAMATRMSELKVA